MRLRILVGSLVLILGLAVYAALVAAVAQRLLPGGLGVTILFYGVAGTVWIVPAALLTRWMQRAAPHHPPSGAAS